MDGRTVCPVHWSRAIALVDMNAFFASVEKRDFPTLRDKPVAVTNGEQGTCIITCSYEARAVGVYTGMRLFEARKLCPDLVQRPARPEVYAQVSSDIMQALTWVCPDVEVFSVDEAFIDITPCQRLYGSPVRVGRLLKQMVQQTSGITCSIGISGDRTTAKYAAKLNKPDGFTVIPPWEAREWLETVPVTELCGIAKGIGRFLAERGVHVCGDMQKLPIGVLAKRFGNPGRRIWYMAQGEDPEPLHYDVAAPKSIGHGKIMPPDTREREVILTYLMHMSVKVCARLRRHYLEAQTYLIAVKTAEGWIGNKYRSAIAGNDTRELYSLSQKMLRYYWQGEGVYQVQITALDPVPVKQQVDMFDIKTVRDREQDRRLFQAIDAINDRYGEMVVAPAVLLKRSKMPNVISPAWKPFGHRKTI